MSLLDLAPGQVGGTENYARSLCQALARVGRHEYRVFTSSRARDAGSLLPSIVVDSYPTGRGAHERLAAFVAARTSRRLRREMRLDELDALHFPLTAMVPRVSRPPSIVTVHDVQHLVMPQFFSRAKLLYRRLAYESSARRADAVIAISAHVRETLLERLELPVDSVTVVYSGVDHERFTPPTGTTSRQPFLLYPAFAWPHKNHARLVEAFTLLRQRHPELRLVLTGGDYSAYAHLDGVDIRGFVSADELVRLYRTASAMVFPSLYEGFGQPMIEAMACGCPVAAANVAAIPEVCGGAARLFDPTQPEAIAEAVEDVMRVSEQWAARGLARAETFSWERTARATDDVYAELG